MRWREMFDWWPQKEQRQAAEESAERLNGAIGEAHESAERLKRQTDREMVKSARVLFLAEEALLSIRGTDE